MKKRIIAMFLVVVMSVLTLASCGYNFAKEDLSAYATFTEEQRKAFEDAIMKVIIEDGEFEDDPTVRLNKVLDNIYASLASKVDEDDKKTEGTAGVHDMIYYCYYVTATFDEKEVVLFASNMKTDSAGKVQMGMLEAEGLEEALIAALAGFDFTDKAYKTETSGTVEAGDVVYVSYTYSYTETVDGVEKDKSVTFTNRRVVVGEDAATFEGYLKGQTVGASISDFKLTDSELGEVSYSGTKVNFIARGDEFTTVKDVTFDESKSVKDVEGVSRELKDKELTYHIFPVHYVPVEEFSAQSLINTIFADSITYDAVCSVLFGEDFADFDDAKKEELVKKYVTKNDMGEDVSLEDFVVSLKDLQKAYKDDVSALDKAKEALEKKQSEKDAAQDKYDTAKKELDDAGEAATEAQKKAEADAKKALEVATTAVTAAEKDVTDAEGDLKKSTLDRDNAVNKLLAVEGASDAFVRGYKISTYNYLQEKHNETIRMNIAKEVYYFLTKNVEVKGTPEKAVKETYDQLIDNYKYKFYNESSSSGAEQVSNYKKYNGSFKNYLIAAVTTDIKTVKTYDEALAAVMEHAKTFVEPIVRIYAVSKAYGVILTDDQIKALKEEEDSNYSYYEYNYGENSVLHAYQFDALMDMLVSFEEEKSEPDENGFVKITYKYNGKVTSYEIGDPVSEAEEDEEEENTDAE